MKSAVISVFVLAACHAVSLGSDDQASTILPPDAATGSTCVACVDDPGLPLAFFGDGHDGNFLLPAGVTVMTRDMFFHDLIFPVGVDSTLVPNGFVVHVANAIVGPGLSPTGAPLGHISMAGSNAIGGVGGKGHDPSGSFAGSGTGGSTSTPTAGSTPGGSASAFGPWPAHQPAGAGGDSGASAGTTPGHGGTGIVLPAAAGDLDIFAAMRMQMLDPTITLAGGAGGGAGAGNGVDAVGGGGGGGAGNLVVLARSVTNPESVEVSAAGGTGAKGSGINTSGGGGGGGGIAAVVVYRKPFPVITVVGGRGGDSGGGSGGHGKAGANGTALPFSFTP